MKSLKKLFLITAATAIGTFSLFHFAAGYISDNIKQEAVNAQYITNNIKYLSDLHTMCLLDYSINPNGKNILEECKKLESEITLSLKHIDNFSYYNFYKRFIE